jgi:hypothetical protein
VLAHDGTLEEPIQTLTDTILILRCAYCISGIEFAPMIAYNDGRFVCRDCAHTVRPGFTNYKCTCRSCFRAARVVAESETIVISSLLN